jgi:hypothetical protein
VVQNNDLDTTSPFPEIPGRASAFPQKSRRLVKPFEVTCSTSEPIVKPGVATPGIFHIRFIDLFNQAPE